MQSSPCSYSVSSRTIEKRLSGVKKGLTNSPPRRVVQKFKPKNLAQNEVADPAIFEAPTRLSDTPPGCHPWFVYNPEIMV